MISRLRTNFPLIEILKPHKFPLSIDTSYNMGHLYSLNIKELEMSRGLPRTFLLVSLFRKGKEAQQHTRRTRQVHPRALFLFFFFSFWWIAFGEDGRAKDMVRLTMRFTPPCSPNPRNPKPYYLRFVKKRDLGDGTHPPN